MLKTLLEKSNAELEKWVIPAQKTIDILPSDFCTICGAKPKEILNWHNQQMKLAYKLGLGDKRQLLEDYSKWLEKHRYIDSDYYTEEPQAIDAFLSTLKV